MIETAIVCLLTILLSGPINVARGGSQDTWFEILLVLPQRQITGLVYFMPGLLLVDWSAHPYSVALQVNSFWFLPGVLTVATQSPGHGAFMDMATRDDKADAREFLDFVPRKVFRLTGGTLAHDFTGMLTKGVLMGLPSLLCWGYLNGMWVAAGISAFAFATMPVWYAINNRWTDFHSRLFFGKPLYWAEWWHGSAIGIGTALPVAWLLR